MEQKQDFSFHKSERLCSKRVIDTLFTGGHKSMSVFPLRVVFMPVTATQGTPPASIRISVSKRRFKKAVKRNRVKRQIREAYRLHKHILTDTLSTHPETGLAIAFLWLSDRLYTSAEVNACIKRLLMRISEQIQTPPTDISTDEKLF